MVINTKMLDDLSNDIEAQRQMPLRTWLGHPSKKGDQVYHKVSELGMKDMAAFLRLRYTPSVGFYRDERSEEHSSRCKHGNVSATIDSPSWQPQYSIMKKPGSVCCIAEHS